MGLPACVQAEGGKLGVFLLVRATAHPLGVTFVNRVRSHGYSAERVLVGGYNAKASPLRIFFPTGA